MRHHQERSGVKSVGLAGDAADPDAEEDRTHVGDRAPGQQLLKVALSEADEADEQDVGHGEPEEPGAERTARDIEAAQAQEDDAVQPELLQGAGMEHRDRSRRGRVAGRRPRMEREERGERAEPEEHQRARGGRDMRGRLQAVGDVLEGGRAVSDAGGVDRD